jgi:predicted glycogen debranching enzyme
VSTINKIPTLYRRGQDTPDRRILDGITRDFSWQVEAGGPSQKDWELLLSREWLVTNGIGGYASGTVSGAPTRRFHGLLIAALPTPHGRTMMLNDVSEQVALPGGEVVDLAGDETITGISNFHSLTHLQGFRLEAGLPVWIYKFRDRVLEKRIHLVNRQNTAHVTYVWRGPDSAVLRVRPSVHFRPHEGSLSGLDPSHYSATLHGQWLVIVDRSDLPNLQLAISRSDAAFHPEETTIPDLRFRIEENRGYDYKGDLWSPDSLSCRSNRISALRSSGLAEIATSSARSTRKSRTTRCPRRSSQPVLHGT